MQNMGSHYKRAFPVTSAVYQLQAMCTSDQGLQKKRKVTNKYTE